MSNQNKHNTLGFKELIVPVALAATLGAAVLKSAARVINLESHGNTHMVNETKHGLGATGHELGTATVRVPKANGTERTP